MNGGFKQWVCVLGAVLALGVFGPGLAGEAPAPPPVPPVPPPAPAAGANEAQSLLEKQAQEDKKLREEVGAQASAHLEAAKRLYAAFDYEPARQELETAVRLDPANGEARQLLSRIGDILSVRRDRIKAAVAQLYGEHRVAVQEKLMELDNRIDFGKRAMDEARTDPNLSLADRIRRYEQARTYFERAKELLKWLPVEVHAEEQTNEVNRLVAETEKGVKVAEARLQEVDREEARRVADEQRANQKRLLDRRINTMVDQAKALFETGKYDPSVAMANKVLELDPTNAEANAIIATAREKHHQARDRYNEEEYKEQFALARERAERFNIPHSDYLVYPDNWREIAQRTSESTRAKTEEPWKQEIRKKLARRVSFEFVDTPLEEALAFLNSLTKVNIILDPKVAAEGASKTPITLRVTDMEMELALKWILRLAELEYDLRNQAVFITKKANLASAVELQIYDIRDLTTTIPDFPGPRIDLGTQAGAGGAGGGVADPFAQQAAPTTMAAADLATLIKDKLLPSEFADPATSIEESGGKLVVMQRPEIHERIAQLLRSFRETQTVQVLTQVRFVDVTEQFLETIGVHFTGLDATPGQAGVPNAQVDPLRQPSRYGLFPVGGGNGPTAPLPSDTQSSPAFQFSQFMTRPPFRQDFGFPSSNPGPAPITILHPRLDANFPVRGNANIGPANAPAGFRRQWWEQAFGSPTLVQGQTINLLRLDPLSSTLGSSVITSPQQGALFQFRFLQSVQANAILQALRKDQTSDQLLAPKLMQFNNQRSHVLVAQQRSYIKDYDVSGAVFDPVISSFLIGVVLEVKPTVSNDKRYITLDCRPGTALELTPPQVIFITNAQNVNVGGGSINLPIELPNLELRSISTTVTIPDQGTMLFSGLINDQKIDAKTGVPFFSDLPIIGRFFSSNNKQRVRRNLLVLVTARVILFDEEEQKL